MTEWQKIAADIEGVTLTQIAKAMHQVAKKPMVRRIRPESGSRYGL